MYQCLRALYPGNVIGNAFFKSEGSSYRVNQQDGTYHADWYECKKLYQENDQWINQATPAFWSHPAKQGMDKTSSIAEKKDKNANCGTEAQVFRHAGCEY